MSKIKTSNESISVVIPTYKDHSSLADCVKCLKKQTIDEDFQIIIVDNDPSPNKIVHIHGENITIIKERKRGSYAARNAGIKCAKEGIIAFTDADCRPDPDWLKNSVEEIRAGSPIVAGLTSVTTSKNPSLVEIYEKCFAFDFGFYKQLNRAPTANLIVSSNVFKSIGGFSELSMSTGDMEWCLRATKAGYQINFCSNIIVYHPARTTFNDILVKTKRVTIGNLEHGFIQRRGYLLKIMKFIIPSRQSITVLFKSKAKLSWRILAFLIYYVLKMYSLYIQFKFKLKY
tara:strand:+ start:1270 stop:2130 length:861 start_codon:yes stop_codon:yes gene_type:complete